MSSMIRTMRRAIVRHNARRGIASRGIRGSRRKGAYVATLQAASSARRQQLSPAAKRSLFHRVQSRFGLKLKEHAVVEG